MTAPDLLPCPFCGELPEITERGETIALFVCAKPPCNGSSLFVGFSREDRDKAIAAWNTRAPLVEALAVPEVAALLGDMLEFLRGLPPDASSGGHCNRDLRARIKQAMLGQSPIRAIGERADG